MTLATGRPRGTIDVLPAEVHRWHHVEAAVRDVCRRFGFSEIRTPVIEHAELYMKSTGEATDILEKETYTFTDRGGRSLTLRPEGTPGVVRAFLENGLQSEPMPAKFYYLGPMFRYDRPQAGRYRQHTQFGVETFGAAAPQADFEVIMTAVTLFRELGLRGLNVLLNSIGCPECRPVFRQQLTEHFSARRAELCPDCQRRLDRNPLRLLDCKEERCQPHKDAAPVSYEHLCAACDEHLAGLRSMLARFGLEHTLDSTLVRGLDYYTRTVFEITYPGLGAQATVCGGGRYDGLVEAMGGPPMPGVGFGLGLERLLLAIERENRSLPAPPRADVFLAMVATSAREPADAGAQRILDLLYTLRSAGIAAEADMMGRSLRQQLRYADRVGARLVAVIGPDELASGEVKLRDMQSGAEAPAHLGRLADAVRAALAR
jgi:histidyl-tRNA synthetase